MMNLSDREYLKRWTEHKDVKLTLKTLRKPQSKPSRCVVCFNKTRHYKPYVSESSKMYIMPICKKHR